VKNHEENMSFFMADTPVFLPNRVVLRSFFTVKLLTTLQVALDVSFAKDGKDPGLPGGRASGAQKLNCAPLGQQSIHVRWLLR
jgi:hypothetical protein